MNESFHLSLCEKIELGFNLCAPQINNLQGLRAVF